MEKNIVTTLFTDLQKKQKTLKGFLEIPSLGAVSAEKINWTIRDFV